MFIGESNILQKQIRLKEQCRARQLNAGINSSFHSLALQYTLHPHVIPKITTEAKLLLNVYIFNS